MKEELEKEKARLEDNIKLYDDQHKEALKMANIFRKQLKQIERAIATYSEATPGEVAQEISEGLQK